MSYEMGGVGASEVLSEQAIGVGERATIDRPLSHGIPARKLLGVLPLARLIPQDVHSVLDYANGVTTLAGAVLSDDGEVVGASVALGASVIGVSAMTDYRLSAAKVIPIEAHEAIDYVWAAGCIAAPFVFGYAKKNPIVAALHIGCGLATIAASLFTDYRAFTGAGRR